VATPKGWLQNPALVLEFYNERRRQIRDAQPNEAHKQLVRLEEKYDVSIVTQNIDDLHERAGSTKILHLHGKITEAKSSGNENFVKDIGYDDIEIGQLCDEGFQMRPNVVWFGESVPLINTADGLAYDAEIFIVIGTSLSVYPAAAMIRFVHSKVPIYVVDPEEVPLAAKPNITFIKKVATEGVKELVDNLLKQ
jgi:NAD-dependent deacetylase